jgi:hypothetical protein
VPFEPFDQAASSARGEGLVKRSRLMGTEVVLHQLCRGLGEVRISQVFEDLGIVLGGMVPVTFTAVNL